MKEAVISLDIGGTNMDGAVVTQDARIVGEVQHMHSVSGQEYEPAMAALLRFIESIRSQSDVDISACGIGMPGPFDYAQGVSLMEHKFRSLHGKNIKQPLEASLGIPVYFLNDAVAFALGAYWKQAQGGVSRLLGVTIGTGLGSGFIEDSRIIAAENVVPQGGEIWNLPYGEGILEDYISGRGIENLYEQHTGNRASPKDIEHRARQGDREALAAYQEMGSTLGVGLAVACNQFIPEQIVVGGKIGRAADLFLDDATSSFRAETGYQTSFVQAETELLPVYGAAKYTLDMKERQ